MCNTYSESGKPCGVQRCEEYDLLKSDRDRLAGVVKGMEEQNARNAKELHWHNQRLVEVMKERDALRQEAADWRSAKYIAEQKETAVHLALNDMRKERDALKTELHEYRYAVQHVTEDGNTTCSYSTSAGWAMVHAERLMDLEVAEEQRDKLLKVREAADALVDAVKGHIAWIKELSPEHDVYILERQVKAYKEARDG